MGLGFAFSRLKNIAPHPQGVALVASTCAGLNSNERWPFRPVPQSFAIMAFSPQLRQTDTNPRQNRNNAKFGRFCPKYGHILTRQDNSAYNTPFIALSPPFPLRLFAYLNPYGVMLVCAYIRPQWSGAVMILATDADASGIRPTFPPCCVRAITAFCPRFIGCPVRCNN